MAEIHVQAKRKTTPVWIWIVVGLLIVGVAAYFLMHNKKPDETNTVNKPAATSFIETPVANPVLFQCTM